MKEVTADEITKDMFMGAREILGSHGVNDKVWAKNVKKLLKAKKIDTFKSTTKDFNEDGHIIRQTEEVIYSTPMDDNKVQYDTTVYLGNLLGHVVVSKQELTGLKGGPIIIDTGIRRPWDED